MTYYGLALLSQDEQFRDRIAACAAKEEAQGDADLGGFHPVHWARRHQWQIAASPGFSDAYQYAIDTQVPDPGASAEVITDAQVLSAVQVRLALPVVKAEEMD